MRALPVLLLLLLAGLPGTARAGLTRSQLAEVGMTPPADARLPPGLALRDEDGRATTLAEVAGGRPLVLLLADYGCETMCGAAAATLAAGLEGLGLTPGADYAPVVLGIDARDGPEAAAAAKAAELADFPQARASFRFLAADAPAIAAVTGALGYRYAFDPEHGQFAHPAAVFLLTADGRLARVLAGMTLVRRDLRLGIVEAGEGRVGTFADRLRLICYGYDAATGVYTARVTLALQLLSAATLLALGAFILALHRRAGGMRA